MAESSPGVGLAIFSCSFQSLGVSEMFKRNAGYDTGGSLNENSLSQHRYSVPGHAHTISSGMKTGSEGRLPDEFLSPFLENSSLSSPGSHLNQFVDLISIQYMAVTS